MGTVIKWEMIPDWANCVRVTVTGSVWASARPAPSPNHIYTNPEELPYMMLANVFDDCDLISGVDPSGLPLQEFRPGSNIKDVIPWAILHKKWKYSFRDMCGWVFVSEHKPTLTGNSWYSHSGECRSIDELLAPGFLSVGSCSWEDSLQERPHA